MNDIQKALLLADQLIGSKLTDKQVAALLARLSQEDETRVLQALHACSEQCRYRLSLADILERMPPDPLEPPGTEAAWDMAIRSCLWDENATIVIHKAIFCAFPFAVWPDRVAARMVFKENYPSMVAKHGKQIHISLGHSAAGRKSALEEAKAAGLIDQDRARQLQHDVEDAPRLGMQPIQAQVNRVTPQNKSQVQSST